MTPATPPCRRPARRGAAFWFVVFAATLFLSLEPGFFLVVLSLGLSALALTWILMLGRLLILDALARRHDGGGE